MEAGAAGAAGTTEGATGIGGIGVDEAAGLGVLLGTGAVILGEAVGRGDWACTGVMGEKAWGRAWVAIATKHIVKTPKPQSNQRLCFMLTVPIILFT